MPAGVPAARIQASVWAGLSAADGATVAELRDGTGTSFQTVAHRLGLWVRAGLVVRTDRRPRRYRLADTVDPSAMPPMINGAGRPVRRAPTAAERLWASMRVLGRFDLPVLMISAGTKHSATRGYVGLLQRAGYVKLERLGNSRTGEVSSYRLIRNTGRRSPVETIRVGAGGARRLLVDRNTGEQHDVSRGTPSLRRSYSRTDADGGVS